jgi:hypothetical protein
VPRSITPSRHLTPHWRTEAESASQRLDAARNSRMIAGPRSSITPTRSLTTRRSAGGLLAARERSGDVRGRLGIVYRLIRAYHRAVQRDEYTTVSTASESRWYNPLSGSLPEIQSLDVDWD